MTKRLHTLEEVNNNVRLLNEMLLHYSQEDSSDGDRELMKELFDRCENKRRTLFKLASETEDNDNSLGDILQASDNLSRVINSYKTIIEGQVINGEVATLTLPDSEGNSQCSNQGTLIDLAELDTTNSLSSVLAPAPTPPSSGIPILPPPPQASGPPRSRSSSQAEATPGPNSTSNTLSLLDEELLCLGLADPAPNVPPKESAGNSQWHLLQREQSDLDFFSPRPGTAACGASDAPLLQPSAPPQAAPKLHCRLPSQLLWSQPVFLPPVQAPSCFLLEWPQPWPQKLSLQSLGTMAWHWATACCTTWMPSISF